MDSNFEFLQDEWPGTYRDAVEAEQHALIAPVTSAFYTRLCLERLIDWLYAHDGELVEPYQSTLSARMYAPEFQALVPPSILRELTFIRKEGNNAVHGNGSNPYVATAALKYLHRFARWVVRFYSERPPGLADFDESLIPKEGKDSLTLKQLQEMEARFEAQQQELQRQRKKLLEQEVEIKRLEAEQAKIEAIKQQNKDLPIPAAPFSEKETRRLFIDTMLRTAGWDPTAPNVSEYPVVGLPTKSGKGKADYVLWDDNGQPLAVVEAKKTTREPYQGQHQAELYADALEAMHGQRPVIFFTNGFETWLWDDTFYAPRKVHGFYSKEELRLLMQRRSTRKDIRKVTASMEIAGRPYQLEAIQRVMETYCKELDGEIRGGTREALLVMATGAGKTRTSAAIVDVLVRAHWVKRVLFLADRNALVRQAKKSYGKLLPDLTSIDLTKEKEDSATRLVFSTYPSMMNRIDGIRSGDERFYGTGHFDLIIVDEAHRSVYQKYRAIFDYFDAKLLGLTATPKDDADKDTYELFGCEVHNPTASYELNEAVADNYLVPARGKAVELGFMQRGIRYEDLSPAEKEEYEATFRDEYGNMPEEINAKAINSWLFNSDTIDKVLHHLMEEGLKIEGGDKLGKSIIFARNHKHAMKIQERFRKRYPQYTGKFLSVIDNYDAYAQQRIDDFSDPNKYPQIAVSVDMLDTGIDIPELLNLVFFKPVYSSSKYWQMIGRGTRLCPDIFGPGEDKDCFYLFDFCNNFDFFAHKPDGLKASVPESLSSRIFKTRLELAQQIKVKQADDLEDYRRELLDFCQAEVERLWQQRDGFRVQMILGVLDQYRHRSNWDQLQHHEVNQLFEEVATLVRLDEADEKAKRYDLTVLQLELAYLKDTEEKEALINRLVRTSERLQGMGSIPKIQAKRGTIDASLGEDFWNDSDISDLEALRKNLRDLIQLVPKEQSPVYETNFQDTVQGSKDVELMDGYVKLENYRKRVEKYIRSHENHLTIHKLKTNTPITAQELGELERLLFEAGDLGGKERFEQEFGHQPLGVFIRRIVGLDQQAAESAFAEFLQQHQWNADQIRFISAIIKHLTVNGVINSRMLMTENTFTSIHDMGIIGLFDTVEISQIVQILEEVKGNALVG